ncbi:MAG: hypothetical protein JXA68_06285 [Ignavibacteriales bacterium]|nr:hypothetical protein [Ignavibacteriales bacterium]
MLIRILMKVFISLLLILNSTLLVGQSDSILFWNKDYSLTVNDFEGEINDSIMTKQFSITPSAVSYIGISTEYKYHDGKLNVIIKTYFNRNKSFCRDSLIQSILEHEQCHFNISELYARKMRREILKLQIKSIYSNQKFDEVIDSLNIECVKYNDLFDYETFYGGIESEQKKWIENVNKELDKLNEYEN